MPRIGKFLWDDGGRAKSGFVGLTGDCVTRAIAIATGLAYRDVYQTLMERHGSSPRNGVPQSVYGPYLAELRWEECSVSKPFLPVERFDFSEGFHVVLMQDAYGRKSHLAAVIDSSLHDTWDPRDDDNTYLINKFWRPTHGAVCNIRFTAGRVEPKHQGDLTQAEFEKIIQRLRAIDNTARNQAATEGERENALRMMQSLMLRHNLTREDLSSQDGIEATGYARVAFPVNSSKALAWEKDLAFYITQHVFPLTQWYSGRKGHRTIFFFYGPRTDVENAIQLFRELLLTIATAAKLLYGGYARGSGASYAEGYVNSLPKSDVLSGQVDKDKGSENIPSDPSQFALMQQRSLVVHERAREWLAVECGIRLMTTTRRLRDFRDPAAELIGRKHGSEHRIDPPSAPKRLL
ncbi:MAG: DUF2786 domain-containing protein [Planctomycetota bacterium]